MRKKRKREREKKNTVYEKAKREGEREIEYNRHIIRE